MSFSDRHTIPPLKAAGCVLYAVLGTLLVMFLLVGAALGHCAPNPDGTGCENDGLIKFLMFPGSLILVVLGGVVLARWTMRDD